MKNVKFKKRISISMIIVSVFAVITCIFGLVSANKMKQPITINSEEEFYEKISHDLNGYYVLNDSIIFKENIKPIGDKDHHFTGMLDGGGHVLSNLVFDMDYFKESCSVENNIYIGLFPFFDGVLINTRFTNIQFLNFNSNNDSIIAGTISGLSNGKISRCDIFGSNIKINLNADKLKFGSFIGVNYGELHFCSMPQNITFQGNANECYIGGFVGISDKKSLIDRSRKKGWIVLEKFNANECYIGGFVALAKRLSLIDCCFSNQNGNAGINCNYQNILEKAFAGSVAGYVPNDGILKIKNCYSNISVSLSAKTQTEIGCSSSLSTGEINCENALFGGRFASNDRNASICDCLFKVSSVQNSFVLDTLVQTGSTNIRNTLNKISISDISLKKMCWNSDYWVIKEGIIDFFL